MNSTNVTNRWLLPVIFLGLLGSLQAHGNAAETAAAKVTIVVHGMMKSKSGAT